MCGAASLQADWEAAAACRGAPSGRMGGYIENITMYCRESGKNGLHLAGLDGLLKQIYIWGNRGPQLNICKNHRRYLWRRECICLQSLPLLCVCQAENRISWERITSALLGVPFLSSSMSLPLSLLPHGGIFVSPPHGGEKLGSGFTLHTFTYLQLYVN